MYDVPYGRSPARASIVYMYGSVNLPSITLRYARLQPLDKVHSTSVMKVGTYLI